jgi:hypothetical protein
MLAIALLAAALPPDAAAADPNACDEAGDEPDVIVGDIGNIRRWGHFDDVTGYSIATTSCNVGTCWLDWYADNGNSDNRHPVIAQNLFRLKDGRFEHIGQSWLKHGFFATSGSLCESGCLATNGEHLGVNCSDPYSTTLNGDQDSLGPKFEVNPSSGFHPHPVTDIGSVGDVISTRLQVHDADLDATLNAGATYFVEAQYVAEDDTLAGNNHNNVSYRPITVEQQGATTFILRVAASTVREQPAIWAWGASPDPQVEYDVVDVPGDGRFVVATRVTDLGGGHWHYEYAVHNQDSDRAVGSFSVPVVSGATLGNVGFHDVEYHSGEPFDGTDWSAAIGSGALTWSTTPFALDPDANALRWGTLYNFRFDLDAGPTTGLVTLGLFKPGSPGTVQFQTLIPAGCNEDSICTLLEECLCPLDCSLEGNDLDGDNVGHCLDCEENNPDLWGTPGEVLGVAVAKGAPGSATVSWSPPVDPGATTFVYDVLRSPDFRDFGAATAICVADGDPSDTAILDTQAPVPGGLFSYLVRAKNACAAGEGGLGTDSAGHPRQGRSCP